MTDDQFKGLLILAIIVIIMVFIAYGESERYEPPPIYRDDIGCSNIPKLAY